MLKDDNNYIGYTQDVTVDDMLFVPVNNGTLHNATAGASNRKEVCKSDTCSVPGNVLMKTKISSKIKGYVSAVNVPR